MKPEELMIGDYLSTISDEPEIIEIDLIDSVEETINGNGLEFIKLEDLAPIELTEQWLLDFGFEKRECSISAADMWQGMDFWYIEDPYGMKITFRADPDSLVIQLTLYPYWNLRCMYVHTLQNLYFALTGQKLTKR